MLLIAQEWFEIGLEQFDKRLGACKVMCEFVTKSHGLCGPKSTKVFDALLGMLRAFLFLQLCCMGATQGVAPM